MVQVQEQALVVAKESKPSTKTKTGIVLGEKATRTIEIYNEAGDECITIGATSSTRTPEVCQVVGSLLKMDPEKVQLISQIGAFRTKLKLTDEVTSKVTALGARSFKNRKKKYEHPVVIIGAGLGGIQTMLAFTNGGREDFICIEKLDDFGGHSWMVVANKFTKLQTEKGTYHVDYILPEAKVPHSFGDMEYKTWPNRDQLLTMFRAQAKAHGFYDKTRFNVSVEKVRPVANQPGYTVQTVPMNEDEDGELIISSAVVAWPGNLCKLRLIDFPGEDEFGGYIDYASFCKVDYTKVDRKDVILYGHGAFTIENVRTLLEHRAKKVFVLCRKRNICGMRVASWLVGQSEVPVPGTIIMEVFQKMYDLVGWDVWSAHSVKTDANRTFAHVSQKTVFGVTDVYFLAGYYGLMEVVVDEIKRLTHHCAHLKKGRKIECEVIVKAVGTLPDFQMDKMLGVKELVGVWANGDPLRPIGCNGMFVEARNFGSFSSGPAFATTVVMFNWFIDYPDDFEIVRGMMPKKKAGEAPCYVPSATHLLPTMTAMNTIPMLGAAMAVSDGLKARKQKEAHPPKQYIAECKAEWEMYIAQFKKDGMVDGRPEPPYPYTVEMCEDWTNRSMMDWAKKTGMRIGR
eukprot:TRINITY_DN5887_c0_g5_i1.p1 TRINITY_DN5887_c0_g5~~TRINITY_DN5887_c0_g5_i1.p1  ORF type:complete len:627 (+),score=105.47 TRINITY_DN5887_c0_g5_i1:85-1965(+)